MDKRRQGHVDSDQDSVSVVFFYIHLLSPLHLYVLVNMSMYVFV